MKFVLSEITIANPFTFDLEVPFAWRDEIGKHLYAFIGTAMRRGVPVNKTIVVWMEWSERVIWDDEESWHTEKTFRSLHFTDLVTHPGFGRMEVLGQLKFRTNIFMTNSPLSTRKAEPQKVGLLIYSIGGVVNEVEVYADPKRAEAAYHEWWTDQGVKPDEIEDEMACSDDQIVEWKVREVK